MLAALSDEQQVAIIRALRDEMAAEGKKAARTSLWSNLLFFVAACAGQYRGDAARAPFVGGG